jgi:hypothetical protein
MRISIQGALVNPLGWLTAPSVGSLWSRYAWSLAGVRVEVARETAANPGNIRPASLRHPLRCRKIWRRPTGAENWSFRMCPIRARRLEVISPAWRSHQTISTESCDVSTGEPVGGLEFRAVSSSSRAMRIIGEVAERSKALAWKASKR